MQSVKYKPKDFKQSQFHCATMVKQNMCWYSMDNAAFVKYTHWLVIETPLHYMLQAVATRAICSSYRTGHRKRLWCRFTWIKFFLLSDRFIKWNGTPSATNCLVYGRFLDLLHWPNMPSIYWTSCIIDFNFRSYLMLVLIFLMFPFMLEGRIWSSSFLQELWYASSYPSIPLSSLQHPISYSVFCP
jgi:hypothetical protein